MTTFSDIWSIIGNVIFGLAVAACVISCMLAWKLRTDVEKLTKRVRKLEKGGQNV